MEWHRRNPQFTSDILISAAIVDPENPSVMDRIPSLIEAATRDGLFSKKDIVQFVGACILVGGNISSVPAVRAALASRPVDEDSFMEKLMLRLGPAYWTHLAEKVESFDA